MRRTTRFCAPLLALAVALLAAGCREHKEPPAPRGYTFNVKETHDLVIKGTVVDLAQIGHQPRTLTWADPNSRYTVSVRVESIEGMDAAACPIQVGEVKHFGIYSVASAFPDRSILNRTYTFQLTYQISDKKKKRYRDFSVY